MNHEEFDKQYSAAMTRYWSTISTSLLNKTQTLKEMVIKEDGSIDNNKLIAELLTLTISISSEKTRSILEDFFVTE